MFPIKIHQVASRSKCTPTSAIQGDCAGNIILSFHRSASAEKENNWVSSSLSLLDSFPNPPYINTSLSTAAEQCQALPGGSDAIFVFWEAVGALCGTLRKSEGRVFSEVCIKGRVLVSIWGVSSVWCALKKLKLTPCANGGMFKWSRVSVTRMSSLSSDNGFLRPARIPYKVLYSLLFTLIVVIIVLLLPSGLTRRNPPTLLDNNMVLIKEEYSLFELNQTYPLTVPTGNLGLWGVSHPFASLEVPSSLCFM